VASVREQEAFLRQKGIHVLFKPFGIMELKQTVWQLLQPG
jgi:hypothetical protein